MKLKNNRARAALLFRLLPAETRNGILPHLDSEEKTALNRGFAEYKKKNKSERMQIEYSLLHSIRPLQAPLWFFSVFMILFTVLLLIHSALKPGISFSNRADLFSPLFLGAFAPLSAYFIPAFRFRYLFRMEFSFEKFTLVFVTFFILIWLIIYIRLEEKDFAVHKDALTFLILGLAALSAPFLEEIFFREMLPSLFGRPPYYAGHFISALLFGAAHFPLSPYMAVLYFLSALFLSALRLNTDSLLMPWIAHACANFMSLMV